MPNGVQPPERRLLTPAPSDYWAMDLTLDEERKRLWYEYTMLSKDNVLVRLRDLGRDTARLSGLTRDQLVSELVDTVCPRAWLDRRLAMLR